jgi:hypothetical protein
MKAARHSAPSDSLPMGILHTNENDGGVMNARPSCKGAGGSFHFGGTAGAEAAGVVADSRNGRGGSLRVGRSQVRQLTPLRQFTLVRQFTPVCDGSPRRALAVGDAGLRQPLRRAAGPLPPKPALRAALRWGAVRVLTRTCCRRRAHARRPGAFDLSCALHVQSSCLAVRSSSL